MLHFVKNLLHNILLQNKFETDRFNTDSNKNKLFQITTLSLSSSDSWIFTDKVKTLLNINKKECFFDDYYNFFKTNKIKSYHLVISFVSFYS